MLEFELSDGTIKLVPQQYVEQFKIDFPNAMEKKIDDIKIKHASVEGFWKSSDTFWGQEDSVVKFFEKMVEMIDEQENKKIKTRTGALSPDAGPSI